MAVDLIKFPRAGDSWEEIDGPGMYVLSVLTREDVADPCAIGAAITLMRPKGRLLTPVAPLWDTDESHNFNVQLIGDLARLYGGAGDPAKAATLRAQVPFSSLSVEFMQVTRLGSTGRTLRNTATGEYWQAGWKDLTPSGTLLLHQIHTCFMRPPTILTFLGDEGDA